MSDFSVDDFADQVAAQVRAAAAQGLAVGAEVLLEEANRTVPIEEATLERSGQTSVDETRLEAAVSYDTPYAVVQHEDVTMNHDPGRRAKWLELTMKERGPEIFRVVGEETRRRLA